jgi:hypothetical protein
VGGVGSFAVMSAFDGRCGVEPAFREYKNFRTTPTLPRPVNLMDQAIFSAVGASSKCLKYAAPVMEEHVASTS